MTTTTGPDVRDVADRLAAHRDSLVADTLRLVASESPSDDLAAIERTAGVVSAIGERLLGEPAERLTVEGRTHVRWRPGSGRGGVLVLGHFDTVWPLGSVERHPPLTDDGHLRGPGCFDMKAGLVQSLHAVAELPPALRSRVTLLFTSDEEIGAITSRALIEAEAAGALAVLVTEPAAPEGALKTERTGASFYRLTAHGLAAHAGLDPARGVNATVELALQVPRILALADDAGGTTVTPTTLRSGATANTVPDSGELAVDVRARTVAEQERVRTGLELIAATPSLDGARLTLTGDHRPPLEASASAGLYERARRVAFRAGLPEPGAAAVGGVSDGNFTAALGIPTLDGLGAVGDGAHADTEHVLVDRMPGQAALLAGIIADLLTERGRP